MILTPSNEPTPRKPLRLWPGVVIVLLQWALRLGVPVLAPEATTLGVLAGVVGALGVVVWWVFFSRAPWLERLGAVLLTAVAMVVTRRFLHESIATGAQGMLFAVLATPVLSLAFVAWALASRRFSDGVRRTSMVATILLACGAWALVRTGGVTGSFENDLMWRWAESPEERLLARAGDEPAAPPPAQAPAKAAEERLIGQVREKPAALPPAPAAAKPRGDWPGFRGPGRDGIARGARIKTDWSVSPPVEMWRRPMGPGWSSFAVRDDLVYTQEQRGDDEVVACYDLTTGKPVWRHRDAARFWESNAGAGPRATPTLSNGRVYTLGGTGILNALDADDGEVVWSRNAASDTDVKVPIWGFAGSPLVVDDVVVVATAGTLAAYDSATGDPRWSGPKGGGGYSSPHLVTIDGVAQVLLLHGAGVISVAPGDGAVLWKYERPGDGIVQPALTADGNLLIGTGSGMGAPGGIRRIAVGNAPGEWTVEERWTSIGLKPYFNDFVVHDRHAYGFDGNILACIDLEDGKRRWKGGRYGNGQLVLLPDQDLLLVLSEQGELALVGATPDQFTELARFPAIEGKTWNHPVLVGDVLLVRNGQEMAAFRLP
jgi:outer membrane protein assembly factor BamB